MSLRASFSMAKTSYRVAAQNPALLVFPMLSTLAGLLILGSFALGMGGLGDLEGARSADDQLQDNLVLIEVGLFYFVSYFCVVFFNVALLVSTQSVLDGEGASLGRGFAGAMQRVGAIAGWALLAAGVGVLLRSIERANSRFGDIVAAIFGVSFTALSFFVVPVLVVEHLGPIAALKRSKDMLAESWLDAFVGHISLGWIGILAFLPPIVIAILIWYTPGLEASRLWAVAIVLIGGFAFAAAVSSAADTIFKLLLYRRAAGEALPADVEAALEA